MGTESYTQMLWRIIGSLKDHKDGKTIEAALEAIPNPARRGEAESYLRKGLKPGDFLTALFCNDLIGAATKAGMADKERLYDWAYWTSERVTPSARGSSESFWFWIESGGWDGLLKHDSREDE